MESQDPNTPGTVPPAGWPWPASSSATPTPVPGLSAEAIQAIYMNPAAFFQRQLDGNPEAYPATLLRSMQAQLLIPTLTGQGAAALNPQQANQGAPGTVAPSTDAHDMHITEDIPGEDKAARRQRKLQEKNRRAQKRFRDRQKLKYQESQQIVDDLTAKVARLTTTVTNLEHSSAVLEKVVKIKDEVIAKLQASQDANPREHDVLRADMISFRKLLGKSEEGIEGTRKWTPEAVRSNHRDYVSALSDCLVEGVEDPQSEAHTRLTALVLSARTLAKTMALVDPQLVSWWHAVPPQQTNLGDAEGDPGPRPGLWKKVLGVMRLTLEQRMDLLEHRKVLLSQLTEVGRQRHEIITSLQSTLPLPNSVGGYTPLAPQNLVQQVRSNIEAEQRAHHSFLNSCFSKTLDAVQEARAQVAAYPHQPDMLAIAELIQEEETLALTASSNNGFHPGQSLSSLTDMLPLKVEGTNAAM
eukprot:jgi/Botrbrau1/1605/Bobra.0185s0020.1